MSGYLEAVREAMRLFEKLESLETVVHEAAEWCIEALRSGHKLLICGNGGSSSEAQHLAGELMGRYKQDRRPLPAVALSADAAVLTCIGNDYCYEEIFARQLEGLAQAGDVFVALSTSGNSENVLRALATARKLGVKSIAFLGGQGGKARELADCALVAPHSDTARAQEAHQFLMHCLMDEIEAAFPAKGGSAR
jgi:D-sedoheptulose 7-phosphate isomerase